MREEDKKRGLYPKYYVQKNVEVLNDQCVHCEERKDTCLTCPKTHIEQKPVDENAEYFVLRIDKDVHARKAALAYADSVEIENPALANDVRNRIKQYE
jgi:hypothetical protein